MRMRWLAGTMLLLLSGPVSAAPLTVAKSSAIVSDPLGEAFPKAIPGAVLDYTTRISNPNVGSASTIVFSDAVPANTALFVGDLGLPGSGPMAATDGSLLGLIGGSGLTYTFTSLSSRTDRIDFSNDGGATWTYVPTPDSGGFDAGVTNVRVSPGGTMNGSSWFSLRFRIRVR